MAKIKIKLIRSTNKILKDQAGTIRALGLRRINQVKEHVDTPVFRGMLFKVKHMVEVLSK